MDLVTAGYCDKCEIQIGYAIGKTDPVSLAVDTHNTGKASDYFFQEYIRKNYDLTPNGIIKYLHLLNVDYNDVSSGGHFGKKWLPWEMTEEDANDLYGDNGE